MSASISIHARDNTGGVITARTHDCVGAPLIITMNDREGRTPGEVTFFIDDQDYAARLVAAINAVERPAARADDEA